jgi:hypothetical protein
MKKRMKLLETNRGKIADENNEEKTKTKFSNENNEKKRMHQLAPRGRHVLLAVL